MMAIREVLGAIPTAHPRLLLQKVSHKIRDLDALTLQRLVPQPSTLKSLFLFIPLQGAELLHSQCIHTGLTGHRCVQGGLCHPLATHWVSGRREVSGGGAGGAQVLIGVAREVKMSLKEFKNGFFCTPPYLGCPPNPIPPQEAAAPSSPPA